MRASSSTPGFRRSPSQIHSASIARIAIDAIAAACIVMGIAFICLAVGGR